MDEQDIGYELKSALPNKLLQADGSITDFAGNSVSNAVDTYKTKPAIPNKVLNADGTYSTLTDVIGGGGGGSTNIFVTVDELPASGNTQKIYLVPNGDGTFAEYHWTGTAWGQIGTTKKYVDTETANVMNILPVVKGEGDNLSLNGTSDNKLKVFDISGNTEQVEYTGKNLFNPVYLNNRYNYRSTSSVTNDVLTITSTESSGVSYTLTDEIEFEPNTSYTVTFDYTGDFMKCVMFSNNYTIFGTESNTNELHFTTTSETYRLKIGIYVTLDSTANISKIQVEKGPIATLYERYTGGVPFSPNLLNTSTIVDNSAYTGNAGDTITITSNEHTFRTPILPVTSNAITISSDITAVNFRVFLLDENQVILDNIWKGSMPQTIDTTGAAYYGIFFSKDYIAVDDNIQIENGSVVTPYKPYGVFPPNPDWPEYVNSVTSTGNIKVNNKNLFTNTSNIVINGSGVESANNEYSTTGFIPTTPNTKYYISSELGTSGNFKKVYIVYYDKYKQFINRDDYDELEHLFTTPSNCYYIRAGAYTQNQTNVMLELNGEKTEYVTPQTQIKNISLSTLHTELCKIGDYKDYIYENNNKWYIHKEIGKVILDGSEDWYREYQTYRFGGFDGKPFSTFSDSDVLAYSDYFKWGNGTSGEFVFGDMWYVLNGTKFVCQKDQNPNDTTLADFKTWLSNNNVTVYYVLATPTDTEITDTTLISQLEDLKTLRSYDGVTNIYSEHSVEDAGMIFTVEAFANMSTQGGSNAVGFDGESIGFEATNVEEALVETKNYIDTSIAENITNVLGGSY